MLNGVARVTGFEDEDCLVGILGEAGGKDETRETTAGDDEVCSGSAARWGTGTRERRKAKSSAVSRTHVLQKVREHHSNLYRDR